MKKDLRAKRSSQIATGILAVLTAILAACSDAAAPSTAPHSVDPTVEQAVAKANAVSVNIPGSFVTQGLLREDPLVSAITVTKVIGSEGGVIDIPAADFQLQIPRGALEGALSISVTALPGSTVAYDLQPRDATFLAPLRIVQRLGRTKYRSSYLPTEGEPEFGLAGFTDPSMVDGTTGVAVASDSLPSQRQSTLSGNQLSFTIWHFSGYMASTGRN